MSGRRTWDKDHYEKRAKERLERLDDEDLSKPGVGVSSNAAKKIMREEFMAADRGAAGPMGSERAFLKVRESRIDLESKVGRTEIIAPADAEVGRGPGFWCDVCTCLLKDSSAYLDHINGKKHQRALGFSMRVERADVTKVKDRLQNIKRKIDEGRTQPKVSAEEDYEARLAGQLAEEEIRKRRKKEEAEARKREKEETELETIDPEIAAIMGFGKLGGKK